MRGVPKLKHLCLSKIRDNNEKDPNMLFSKLLLICFCFLRYDTFVGFLSFILLSNHPFHGALEEETDATELRLGPDRL